MYTLLQCVGSISDQNAEDPTDASKLRMPCYFLPKRIYMYHYCWILKHKQKYHMLQVAEVAVELARLSTSVQRSRLVGPR